MTQLDKITLRHDILMACYDYVKAYIERDLEKVKSASKEFTDKIDQIINQLEVKKEE